MIIISYKDDETVYPNEMIKIVSDSNQVTGCIISGNKKTWNTDRLSMDLQNNFHFILAPDSYAKDIIDILASSRPKGWPSTVEWTKVPRPKAPPKIIKTTLDGIFIGAEKALLKLSAVRYCTIPDSGELDMQDDLLNELTTLMKDECEKGNFCDAIFVDVNGEPLYEADRRKVDVSLDDFPLVFNAIDELVASLAPIFNEKMPFDSLLLTIGSLSLAVYQTDGGKLAIVNADPNARKPQTFRIMAPRTAEKVKTAITKLFS